MDELQDFVRELVVFRPRVGEDVDEGPWEGDLQGDLDGTDTHLWTVSTSLGTNVE